MAAMNEVSDFLPDTVLLDYIRAQIPSNDKLWTFRKHLAVQYACQVTCRALHNTDVLFGRGVLPD